MPVLQSIVLADRTTPTPVNHTFTPRDVKAGVGVVVSNAGVPLGEEVFSVQMRKMPNGKFRGKLTLKVPVVATETINGISEPKLVRTAYATLDVTFDERSSEQERKNLIGMIQSALDPAKALVNDALVKLEGVYGS